MLVVLGGLAALLVFAAYTLYAFQGSATSPIPSRFTLNGKTFAITDTATNAAMREAGLMGRQVTETTVMLFVFPSPGYYKFWMYGTNSSLDMIWVSADGDLGRVVYVVSSAEPCSVQSSCIVFAPTVPASYVLEAKSGFIATNHVEVGTLLVFS